MFAAGSQKGVQDSGVSAWFPEHFARLFLGNGDFTTPVL